MSHSIKYIRKEKGRTYSAHIAGPFTLWERAIR